LQVALLSASLSCCSAVAPDTRADLSRRLAVSFAGELVVVHAGHVNEDVDAVHERSAQSLAVADDVRERAAALLQQIAVVAARTFMEKRHAAK
jgi:hypothetical protein